jgi:hypothetical protein
MYAPLFWRHVCEIQAITLALGEKQLCARRVQRLGILAWARRVACVYAIGNV